MKKFKYNQLCIINCINKVAKREYWISYEYGKVTFWNVQKSGSNIFVNCINVCSSKMFRWLFIESGYCAHYDYKKWVYAHSLSYYLGYLKDKGSVIVYESIL